MAKQLTGQAKFQIPGGQATPAPPVGTSLGKFGINLGQFVQQFNDRTKEYNGTPIPVIVSVYNDRTFDFVTKSPPAAAMLKQAAGIASGSGVPNKTKVGTVTRAQIEEICNKKMADLNASDMDSACRMIEGTRLPFLGNISKIRPSKTSPLTIFLGFCGAKRRKSGFGRQFFQNGSWKIPISKKFPRPPWHSRKPLGF